MQIKYLVIMDTLALVLLGTWFGNEGRIRGRDGLIKNFQTAFKFYLILGIGLILPAIIIASIYQFYGYFDEYIYGTLSANSKYVAMLDFSWSDLLSRLKKQVLGNILLWLCLFFSPIYFLRMSKES